MSSESLGSSSLQDDEDQVDHEMDTQQLEDNTDDSTFNIHGMSEDAEETGYRDVLDRLNEPGESLGSNGTTFQSFKRIENNHDNQHALLEDGIQQEVSIVHDVPTEDSPAEGDRELVSPPRSTSTPDYTPSLQGSLPSSPGSGSFFNRGATPTLRPSLALRPFDRRFSSRLSPSPLASPRPSSPAFLNTHSRNSSISSSRGIELELDTPDPSAPWDVVRWTKLKKITAQIFSEVGLRNYGHPTCITIFSSIALGTSKGLVLVFDYHQILKTVIGLGTKAVESGPVTSLAISADYTTIAGGHSKGDIFTWELARHTKPFLHIPHIPLTQNEERKIDGHVEGASVLHLGFLGTRHTALVSADDKGMAFSHLASRSMVGRVVKTTRILGRYPFDVATNSRPRKPSAVLGFGSLPLGNAVQATDSMGIVAMLTPYLLVIVSTTPIAQTQHKLTRPKEVANEVALSGCLAWFPATKPKLDAVAPVKSNNTQQSGTIKSRLAYCWSNVLSILEVSIDESAESTDPNKPPTLHFRTVRRWKCDEAIVAIQWLNRQVLGILTISQRLLIIEEPKMRLTETFDLLRKEIFRQDLFSRQLRSLIGQIDEEGSLYASVADAFYNSMKTYKGRIFLLGSYEVSVGALSNWADRLLALMEMGDFIAAIHLATDYYNGDVDNITVGLPENNDIRHSLVQEKLIDMMSASLRYAFGLTANSIPIREREQLQELANACFTACLSMEKFDFLFEVTYDAFEEGSAEGVFLESLEPYILDRKITSIPPGVVKSLVLHFISLGLETRLEEMLCHIDPQTMDIDQVTTLCEQNNLYDALIYVWNQALSDYITPLTKLLELLQSSTFDSEQTDKDLNALKIFPYLSYILTSRIYPTGDELSVGKADAAKATLYYFLLLGRNIAWPKGHGKPFLTRSGSEAQEPPFPYLRMILEFDAPSFLSVMNEAFEDPFLNGTSIITLNNGDSTEVDEDQVFGRSVNRQYIVSILLEVMAEDFEAKDTIYLDIFIARNLPKYPQYLLLPGNTLQKILMGLCNYPGSDIADDCQLSVEYLLSVYHPPDIKDFVEAFTKARFYRVLKSTFRVEKDYPRLLQAYFDDPDSGNTIFECIADCLKTSSGLSEKQRQDVKLVMQNHAENLVSTDSVMTAKTVNSYAPELHQVMLDSMQSYPEKQFVYLRVLIEPQQEKSVQSDIKPKKAFDNHMMLELYVRHMCVFDPAHVADFIETLQSGDLNLERVLPALEESGAVDAVVHLMTREGLIREAMDKLLMHLLTLETSLSSLLKSSLERLKDENKEDDDDDISFISRPVNETLNALQKYSLVGIWLCRGQMRNVAGKEKERKRKPRLDKDNAVLSFEETLWLDLVDAIVRIAKNTTLILKHCPKNNQKRKSTNIHGSYPATPLSRSMSFSSSWSFNREKELDYPRIILSMRRYVQDIFTALLAATTSSSAINASISFLRVFQSFLDRAALSSPSLADLRNVLAGIFDAYMYEEQLLSLSRRLLDRDLFVQVKEVSDLRQKGWRAHGQTCEVCGEKLWGAGATGGIYTAWEKKRDAEEAKQKKKRRDFVEQQQQEAAIVVDKGKGVKRGPSVDVQQDPDEDAAGEDSVSNTIVVFSCKHLFHRICLEKLYYEALGGSDMVGKQGDLWKCIICQ